MPADPLEEWRRLTQLYAEMGDVEIRELADQINDLTETAQQILRDEVKKRGLSESRSPEAPKANPSASVHTEPRYYRYQPSDTQTDEDEDGSHEYTWKTPLCDCESNQEARQRAEMLRRAGIDSWLKAPGASGSLDMTGYQIEVAADQLDQAQAIVTQPIPQDIIDQLKEEESASAYEPPVCPKCAAADPILESVEPSNNWLCESCGHTWSDPVTDPTASPQSAH
jgi:ribosomal protein L37AE/L43A